jgi:hypothetical protein
MKIVRKMTSFFVLILTKSNRRSFDFAQDDTL